MKMETKKGIVFNIQRFCVNDGPGIRTTVFLKGCMLNCVWCHNPESKSKRTQIMYYADKCIGCGECASACSVGAHVFEDGAHAFDRDACNSCGECASVCVGALEICGEEKSVEQVQGKGQNDAPESGSKKFLFHVPPSLRTGCR